MDEFGGESLSLISNICNRRILKVKSWSDLKKRNQGQRYSTMSGGLLGNVGSPPSIRLAKGGGMVVYYPHWSCTSGMVINLWPRKVLSMNRGFMNGGGPSLGLFVDKGYST